MLGCCGNFVIRIFEKENQILTSDGRAKNLIPGLFDGGILNLMSCLPEPLTLVQGAGVPALVWKLWVWTLPVTWWEQTPTNEKNHQPRGQPSSPYRQSGWLLNRVETSRYCYCIIQSRTRISCCVWSLRRASSWMLGGWPRCQSVDWIAQQLLLALFSSVCSLAISQSWCLGCLNMLYSLCWGTLHPSSATLKPLMVSCNACHLQSGVLTAHCFSAFELLAHKPDWRDGEKGWLYLCQWINSRKHFSALAVNKIFAFWK